MPVGIPIQQLPNQSFSITLDGTLFDVTLKTTNGVTAATVAINGTTVIEDGIAAACAPIIPTPYLEAGNFMFLTANQQLPDYRQFGLTQSLFYFTAAELAAYRTPPVAASPMVPTMTVNSFNPIGQLPLRFAPQGYVEA